MNASQLGKQVKRRKSFEPEHTLFQNGKYAQTEISVMGEQITFISFRGKSAIILATEIRLYASYKCEVHFEMTLTRLKAQAHTSICICWQRHAFKNTQKNTYKQTGYDKNSKEIMTTQIPRVKAQLFATKSSLQAVNSHRHSSNLSTALQMILCSYGSFQSWRKGDVVSWESKTKKKKTVSSFLSTSKKIPALLFFFLYTTFVVLYWAASRQFGRPFLRLGLWI